MISLTRIDPTKNQARFYALSIQSDLFGGWDLVREWGRLGGASRTKIDHFADILNAQRALERIVRRKVSGGYAWREPKATPKTRPTHRPSTAENSGQRSASSQATSL